MQAPHAPTGKTVLIIGAGGFLGGHIAARMRRAGWRVLRGVRNPTQPGDVACDFTRETHPKDWVGLLAEADVVVNAAGILREQGGQTFEAVHHTGPVSLGWACAQIGKRFVQISALGEPHDGEFIASKHRADTALIGLAMDCVILRPSIVYTTGGSYGGTSLLRAISACPGILPLPSKGQFKIQPVDMYDFVEIVLHACEGKGRGLYEVVGPDVVSLREYQMSWRQWLDVGYAREIHIPKFLISLQAWISEGLGRGPLGLTMWRMLKRGNVGKEGAVEALANTFGVHPWPLARVLAAHPSQVQDRWHARLYFIGPTLQIGACVLFLISGVAGALQSKQDLILQGRDLPDWMAIAGGWGGAGLDIALAAWLFFSANPRKPLGWMIFLVSCYTVFMGIQMGWLWFDPMGGLAKNLVILPALVAAWVLADRR